MPHTKTIAACTAAVIGIGMFAGVAAGYRVTKTQPANITGAVQAQAFGDLMQRSYETGGARPVTLPRCTKPANPKTQNWLCVVNYRGVGRPVMVPVAVFPNGSARVIGS